ncbi:ceramide-1-phosphate transfer protein [Haematobia irritans]|uniref:ceramide-1-phosphate transfer protein n=1 Tax=Haematobia irritans TaxID=7368 RepID=UPI003F504C55
MSTIERFDIEKVTKVFQECLRDEDDVIMDDYLNAYEEINKFFLLLGSVFGFVSSDVRTKIDILTTFRKGTENADKFVTFKTMILYEVDSGLLKDSKYVSGSRTLLRLHRGLEFIYEFLTQLADLAEDVKVQQTCKAAYENTLAKHHTWVIRKGAVVAMYTLPTKEELMKRVCANVSLAKELLPEMLKNTKIVYDRTHALYDLHDLHSLP